MRKKEKANLAMTYEDYIAVGSSPIANFHGLLGVPLHEMYDDEGLRNYVAKEVEAAAEVYEKALAGDEIEKELLDVVLNGFLAPNVAYLREVGRLPKEFEDLDPLKKFALPT